jgi:hypothetical protein
MAESIPIGEFFSNFSSKTENRKPKTVLKSHFRGPDFADFAGQAGCRGEGLLAGLPARGGGFAGGAHVGAAIHGYVPEGVMAGIMGRQAWWSVPLAVIIGVPIYSNAAGIIPVVQALLAKGAALGTVLAFMMAVIGLSLPEAIILRKVLKPRLMAVFIGVVAVGIMLVGWIFNVIL